MVELLTAEQRFERVLQGYHDSGAPGMGTSGVMHLLEAFREELEEQENAWAEMVRVLWEAGQNDD